MRVNKTNEERDTIVGNMAELYAKQINKIIAEHTPAITKATEATIAALESDFMKLVQPLIDKKYTELIAYRSPATTITKLVDVVQPSNVSRVSSMFIEVNLSRTYTVPHTIPVNINQSLFDALKAETGPIWEEFEQLEESFQTIWSQSASVNLVIAAAPAIEQFISPACREKLAAPNPPTKKKEKVEKIAKSVDIQTMQANLAMAKMQAS